jgi:methanogenic corrinoid protein MtbC1
MSNRGEFEPGAHFDAASCIREIAHGPGPNPERLAAVVLDDIVPRLRTLHHRLSAKTVEDLFSREDVAAFGDILLRDDGAAADRFLKEMRTRGFSEEAIVLGLITGTARHLGALWEADLCSFVDVTIGLGRLHRILCAFGGAAEPVAAEDHRILLSALVGESHVFGMEMVACFMRRASWDVELRKEIDARDVAKAVAESWFAVAGFTLSAESGVERLCEAIHSARAASFNPSIAIVVGGPLFLARPHLVTQVGADAMASDAVAATLLAKRLLQRQPASHLRHPGRAPTGHGLWRLQAEANL